MKFHYEFNIKRSEHPLEHSRSVLLIGSCFTESMGEKLRKHKFTTMENPNGILFNPISVCKALTNYINNTRIVENDIFEYNETWHSWDHHSRFSALSNAAGVEGINNSTADAHVFLQQAGHVLITLGSAWVYTLTDKALNASPGQVAANNHKAPADWFEKRLMTVSETVSVLETTLDQLRQFNPNVRVIFTISPVRHLREGVVENNRSKAVLIQAVHELIAKNPSLYYFPAYEIVIDDLRDYRFYAEDLVHPNYQATQYVWQKFTEACMSEETRKLLKEIAEINLAFQHRPFNPSTQMHRKFLSAYYEKTNYLQQKYPILNLQEEIRFFQQGMLE